MEKSGTGVQKLNCSVSDSNQQLNEMIQKSSAHFKYYIHIILYDYNEYIQHTAKRLRADQKKTRSSRTGSLTSSSSNVQFRNCIIRTSAANPNKRDISNWNDLVLLGNCCKIGTTVEKIGYNSFSPIFFYIFIIIFYVILVEIMNDICDNSPSDF